MRAVVNLAGGLVWFPLQAIVITRLLRGEWRRYPLIFVFVLSEFLVFAAQFPTVWAATYQKTADTLSWRVWFYVRGEIFLELLTFVVVISLIFRATSHLQSRVLMRAGFVAGAVLFVGISLRAHYDANLMAGVWMAPWTRDLNLCTTILDLALWSLLLAQRKADSRLLLLSGALGIQFTGAAIGHSLRSLATRQHPWPSILGAAVVVTASLIRVYLWGRAFRAVPLVAGKEVALEVPSGSQ